MMDNQTGGNPPDVRRYFRKILNSLTFTLLWLMNVFTFGLFFRLAFTDEGVQWYTLLFYGLALVSFALLMRYLYRTWK
jgi:uncharacterized membrane protein